jgi:Holliday junction resolvase RusA-like endonuclease
MLINIKPLSVNQAWKGRRFKTKAYDKYISDMMLLLPPLKVSNERLELEITFGLSSRAADIDNPLKCFIDCLQKKYGFDDKMIYRLIVNKVITKKGSEYIQFNIKAL